MQTWVIRHYPLELLISDNFIISFLLIHLFKTTIYIINKNVRIEPYELMIYLHLSFISFLIGTLLRNRQVWIKRNKWRCY